MKSRSGASSDKLTLTDNQIPQYYQVENDESLISIAIKFNINQSKLKSLNKSILVGGDKVFVGAILKLFETPSVKQTSSSSSVTVKSKTTASAPSNVIESVSMELKKDVTDSITSLGLNFSSIFSLSSASSAASTSTVLQNSHTQDVYTHGNGDNSDDNDDDDMLDAAPREIWEYENGPFLLVDNIRDDSGIRINIFKQVHINQLKAHLPNVLQIDNLKLLYSFMQNGCDLLTFYNNVRDSKYSILVIETVDGEMLGGFTSESWTSRPKYYGTGESFVFKISKQGVATCYTWSTANTFFMYSTDEELGMGGGGDGFAFILDTDFVHVKSSVSATFSNDVLLSAASSTNVAKKVRNIECWGFESYINRKKVTRYGSKS